MSVVDNGNRRRLIIAGLFEGVCGEANGEIAFIPNLKRKRSSDVTRGLLDDVPVDLTLKRRPTSADPFAVFTYKAAGE